MKSMTAWSKSEWKEAMTARKETWASIVEQQQKEKAAERRGKEMQAHARLPDTVLAKAAEDEIKPKRRKLKGVTFASAVEAPRPAAKKSPYIVDVDGPEYLEV
jgi:hypothetical protein